MNWNKWNRWIHRDLGYLFFGMSLVYGVSGIALNHGVARHWDPGIVTRSEELVFPGELNREEFNREMLEQILDLTGEKKNYKNFYFPEPDRALLYLRGGQISVDLNSGRIRVTKIRNRPVFNDLNYLHYNKPKKLWTWFSDLFALGLILLAITGLFLVKGRKGLRGRGGVLTLAGILVPLVFLFLYLWT